MSQIDKTATEWGRTYSKTSTKPETIAHDSFLVGYSIAKAQAVSVLKKQFAGFKGLVSYAIAADVLQMEMDALEKEES